MKSRGLDFEIYFAEWELNDGILSFVINGSHCGQVKFDKDVARFEIDFIKDYENDDELDGGMWGKRALPETFWIIPAQIIKKLMAA